MRPILGGSMVDMVGAAPAEVGITAWRSFSPPAPAACLFPGGPGLARMGGWVFGGHKRRLSLFGCFLLPC